MGKDRFTNGDTMISYVPLSSQDDNSGIVIDLSNAVIILIAFGVIFICAGLWYGVL